MATLNTLLTAVQDGLKKSPLMTNTILALALTALEKITEIEFACPCSQKYNVWFSAVFFVLPVFLVCLLMIITRDWSDRSLLWKNIAISLIPAVVWLILVFVDGQYFACAMTSWNGRFIVLDKAGPKKWCKPNDTSNSKKYMTLTQQWYSMSQAIGMMLALVLAPLAISITRKAKTRGGKTEEKTKNTDQPTDKKDPEGSPLLPDTAGSQGATTT